MLIYQNNLHEKLQGLAISRDYLKYKTPFCDLVDSPEWQVDINLALDYHKGTNGDLDSANKFVQDLTINSNTLDYATIEYYTHKIKYNPGFRTAIKEMRARWNTPDAFSDDFQNVFNQALKDCLNSPCNLFAESSDSIARMAQAASTKTTANTFGVGELSGSFINMVDGLDDTITNKLPAVFKNAYIELTSVASKAFENTQAVLTGKENLTVFYDTIRSGKSLRDPAKSFRYSPDVQSYYDYSAASSDVLAAVKKELGGCFNRFQYRFRSNPYDKAQNQKTPIRTGRGDVNGVATDENSVGQTRKYAPSNKQKLDNLTTTKQDVSKGSSSQNSNNLAEISSVFTVTPNGRDDYTVFAAYVDQTQTPKIIYTDPYDATPNDEITRSGQGSIGPNYLFAPSIINITSVGQKILNGKWNKATPSDELHSVAGQLNTGWKHVLTDTSMETLYNKSADLIYNDGVAISLGVVRRFVNDPNITLKDYRDIGINGAQINNELFVAVRPISGGTTSAYKFYKVIDVNGQENINLDFTVGAFQHFLNSFKSGKKLDNSKAKNIPGVSPTEWKEVVKNSQAEITDDLEFFVCRGTIDDIKKRLNEGNTNPDLSSLGESTDNAGRTLLPRLPEEPPLFDGIFGEFTAEEEARYNQLLQKANLTPEEEKEFNRLWDDKLAAERLNESGRSLN